MEDQGMRLIALRTAAPTWHQKAQMLIAQALILIVVQPKMGLMEG